MSLASRTSRRRWRLAAYILLPALIVGSLQATDLSQAAAETPIATACDPNSDYTSAESSVECIDGVELSTRNKIQANCLAEPKSLQPLAVYEPAECLKTDSEARLYVEFIAQARGIARLNSLERAGGSVLGGISASLQWEVRYPGSGYYPDLIRYDPNDTGSQDIELVEYKLTRGASQVPAQLSRYETNWPGRGNLERSAELAAQLSQDRFTVRTTQRCSDGRPVFNRYVTVTNGVAGAVLVKLYETTDCQGPGGYRDVDKDLSEDEDLNNRDRKPPIVKLPKIPTDDDDRPNCAFLCPTQEYMVMSGVAAGSALLLGVMALLAPEVTAVILTGVTLGVILHKIWDALPGGIFGDPHVMTLDGLSYDLQSVGEFELVKTQDGVDVQARLKPVGNSTTVSEATDYALELNGYRVEINRQGQVLVDGGSLEIPEGSYAYFGRGSALTRTDGMLTAIWPGDGDRPMFMYKPAMSSMRMYVPDGTRTTGLLGNHDGIKNNDLRVQGGAQLPPSASPTTIHGTYADSWRVSQSRSMFSYAPGESTATFADLDKPSNLVSVEDFSLPDREAAETECRDARVVEGSALRACIYDQLVSGSDAFLSSAVDVTRGGSHGLDQDLDGSGDASQDFESEVPANFSYGRLGSDNAYGKFAGPFRTTDIYGFSAHSPSPHDGAEVSFDLLVVGDWSSTAVQKVAFDIDGKQQTAATLTGDPVTGAPVSAELGQPKAAGTFTSGQKYWVFELSVTSSEASASDLTGELKLTGSGSGRAFGIDNIEVHADLVVPEQFSIAMGTTPTEIGADQPAIGAGNIESPLARDEYTFAMPSGNKTLMVDMKECSRSARLVWRLKSSAGAELKSGSCPQVEQIELPQGTYTLTVESKAQRSDTYRTDLYLVPDPHIFDLALTTTPLQVSDGIPGAGAGNIETIASKDIYRFTVPTGGRDVQIDHGSGPYFGYGVKWNLINRADGSVIASGDVSQDKQIPNLAAGDYQLEHVSAMNRTGPYDLKLFFVPDPQTFNIPMATTPLSVSDGVPGAGAGNIETIASKDIYRFTVPSGGRSLHIDNGSGPSAGHGIGWKLINRADGSTVASGDVAQDKQIPNLAANDYQLEYTSASSKTGTYNFNALFIPDPQVFDIVLATTPVPVSDGVPGAGAGNIETIASKDIYRFTVPTGGGALQVDNGSGPLLGNGIDWKLINRANGSTVGSGTVIQDRLFTDLAPGDYQLEYTSAMNRTGAYDFKIFFVPDPHIFDLALTTTPLQVSDGIPGAGAGNIETIASKDIYRFSVPTGGRDVQIDHGSGPYFGYGVKWNLINRADGSVIASGDVSQDKQIPNLAAGDYQLEHVSAMNRTGPYDLKLSAS